MSLDFDASVERAGTWSTRWERYAGRDVIPLWVADSDFRAPPCVLEALEKRIRHGVFGYTTAPDELRSDIASEKVEQIDDSQNRLEKDPHKALPEESGTTQEEK